MPPSAEAKITVTAATQQAQGEFSKLFLAWRNQIEAATVNANKFNEAIAKSMASWATMTAQTMQKVGDGYGLAGNRIDALLQTSKNFYTNATTDSNKYGNAVQNALGVSKTATDDFSKAQVEVEKKTSQASQGFKLFGMNIVDIAAKFYLLQTSMRFVYDRIVQLFKIAELGAQVQQSDISFAHLLQTLGAAPDTMDRLREAAGGLATDYELQSKSAIVLTGTSGELGKQLAENLPQLMEIARAAKVVNPAIRDVDYAYESLTTGIKRGEKRWLDNIGIIFRAEDAYEEYAKTIGKSVEELSAEDKQLAYLYKTLEMGQVITDQAGGSIESLTDKYGSLKTNLTEVKQAFGIFLDNALAPAIAQMVVLTDFTGGLNSQMEGLAHSGRVTGEVWRGFNDALQSGWAILPGIGPMIGSIVNSMKNLEELKGLESLTLDWEEFNKTLERNVARQKEIRTQLEQSFSDEHRKALKTELEDLTREGYVLMSLKPVAEEAARARGELSDAMQNGISQTEADAQAFEKWKSAVEGAFSSYFKKVVDIHIKATDEQKKLEAQMTKAYADEADKRLKVETDLAADKIDVYKGYQSTIADINDRYDEQRIDKLKEIQAVEDEIAGKMPVLKSDQIKASIGAIDDQTSALKKQLSVLEQLRDKAVEDLGSDASRREKIADMRVEAATIREQANTTYELTEAQRIRLRYLEEEANRLETMPPVSSMLEQQTGAFTQQIEIISKQLEKFDTERAQRESELNKTLLGEKLTTLQTELQAIEDARTKDLASASAAYDANIQKLVDTAEAAKTTISTTTQETVDGLMEKIRILTKDIPEELKKAFVDGMLSLTEPGSPAETALLQWKLSTHGITLDLKAMIEESQNAVKMMTVLGPDSIISMIDEINNYGGIDIPVVIDTSEIKSIVEEGQKEFSQLKDYYHGTSDVNLIDFWAKIWETMSRVFIGPGAGMNFDKRQHGGSVAGGRGYIVGEAGPELFMPKSSGTIIPNNALGSGMNVNISAGAFLGSRADAIRLGNELAPIIARSLKAHGIQIQ